MVSTFGDEVALVALTLRLQLRLSALRGRPAACRREHPVAAPVSSGRPSGRLARLPASPGRRRAARGGVPGSNLVRALGRDHRGAGRRPRHGRVGGRQRLGYRALVPRIVGEDHVAEAVSAGQSLNALVAVGAPAVGGPSAGAFGTGLPCRVVGHLRRGDGGPHARPHPADSGGARAGRPPGGGSGRLRPARRPGARPAHHRPGRAGPAGRDGGCDVVLVFLICGPRCTPEEPGDRDRRGRVDCSPGSSPDRWGPDGSEPGAPGSWGDDRGCGRHLRCPRPVRRGPGGLDARTAVGARRDRERIRKRRPCSSPARPTPNGAGYPPLPTPPSAEGPGSLATRRRSSRRRAQPPGDLRHGRTARRGRRDRPRRLLRRPGDQNRPAHASPVRCLTS